MKTIERTFMMTGLAALLMMPVSCVKKEVSNTTHPDSGTVVVTADFSEKSQEAVVPEEYILDIGGEVCKAMPGIDFSHPASFAPGSYLLTAYNECAGMTLSGSTMAVNANANGTVEPLPGYLFAQSREIDVTADNTLHVNLPMEQRVRDLRLRLNVTEGDPERIESMTGTLSGIAGAFDLTRQVITGEAASTRFAFTRDGDKVSADLRLLGTIGAQQKLIVEITFTDGQTQTVETSMSETLADFNSGLESMTLEGNLLTPTEIGVGGYVITPWEVVDGGDVSVHP